MGGGRGAGVGGDQGRCKRRSDVFFLIQKKIFFLWGNRVGGWGRVGVGTLDVNEEVFVKIKRKIEGGWGRVGGRSWGLVGWGRGQRGCERRIEVFEKIQKKKSDGWSGWGVRWGPGWWGFRVDVNAMLGVGGGVG